MAAEQEREGEHGGGARYHFQVTSSCSKHGPRQATSNLAGAASLSCAWRLLELASAWHLLERASPGAHGSFLVIRQLYFDLVRFFHQIVGMYRVSHILLVPVRLVYRSLRVV